jgi:hypothetical protein
MRAERYRASRIRSPSWRNEPIENEIRQKPGGAGLFFGEHVARRIAVCEFLAPRLFAGRGAALCTNAGVMRLRLVTNSIVPLIDRARFSKHQPRLRQRIWRDRGLPSINAQKKVRLFSHLSA